MRRTREFDDVFLLGCKMRSSYALNDIMYNMYAKVSNARAREIVAGLTAYEARLVRGRILPPETRKEVGIFVNGRRYIGTFVKIWNHIRNIVAINSANGMGVPVARPSFTNSRDSKRTFEFCRKAFCFGHKRLVEIMDELEAMPGFEYADEPQWSFPKGRAPKSDSETEIETAIREFYEETHCDIDEAFIRSRLLRDSNGNVDYIDETIVTDSRIFRSRYFIFVDPRPLSPLACNIPLRISRDVEVSEIFWRRADAFVDKWTGTETSKLKTLRELFIRRF